MYPLLRTGLPANPAIHGRRERLKQGKMCVRHQLVAIARPFPPSYDSSHVSDSAAHRKGSWTRYLHSAQFLCDIVAPINVGRIFNERPTVQIAMGDLASPPMAKASGVPGLALDDYCSINSSLKNLTKVASAS